MSTQDVFHDPMAAAEILAALQEKDQNEAVCRYPTCYEPRQATTRTGRPYAYCQNPDHTALTNHRARQHLKAIAANGTPAAASIREVSASVVVIAPVESLRSSVVGRITQLQNDMERYLAVLTEMADPDLSAAQIQAALDRAEARIADTQHTASAERSLRLAADAARQAAHDEARAAQETATQATRQREEAEARLQRLIEETNQQMAALRRERDETVAWVQAEAQHQIEACERQASEALAHAQTETATAQEEARRAEAQAHDAEIEAQAKVASAEQLVRDTRTTLERERTEVDRLRAELTGLRTQMEAERAEHRATLQRERTEVDRLRADLSATRARADQLATVADDLRMQLVTATEQLQKQQAQLQALQ